MHPNPVDPLPWRWPQVKLRWALLAFGLLQANALWRAATAHLDLRASGYATPFAQPLVWEFTSSLMVWGLLLLVKAVVLNAPWKGVRATRFLALHAAGCALFWALHVLGMWSLRIGIYRIAGWGPYGYGETLPRLAMEGLKDILTFAMLALLFHLLEARRARQARDLAAARLEVELKEARLQALSAQLDPHFLFNALNTLSALMYEDLPRTDRLFTALGRMLRDSLECEGPTWPLTQELEHLHHYLAFVEARFGERLQVETSIAPGLGDLAVPRFALQRLVENALKHNTEQARQVLRVKIQGIEAGPEVHLTVQDDGVGFRQGPTTGLGLDNLRRSLALLHGDAAKLVAEEAPGGGARVSLQLPRGGSHA